MYALTCSTLVAIEFKAKALELQRARLSGQLEGGDRTPSYLELIDGLLWLFNTSAYKQVLKVTSLQSVNTSTCVQDC